MKKIHGDSKKLYLRGWFRFLKSLKRKNKYYYPQIGVSQSDKKLKIKNPILDFIKSISLVHGDNIGLRGFDGVLKVPRKFTFFEQPEIALQFIYRAMRLVKESSYKAVTLSYENASDFCLGAECLLSLALSEASKSNSNIENGKVLINGVYPVDPYHLEIIRDAGLVRLLNEAEDTEVEDSSNKDGLHQKQIIFINDSIGKENSSAYADDSKNKAAEEFTKYINKCINPYSLELLPDAEEKLKSCMGELLDNAERHCGLTQRPRWYVRGFVNHSHSHPVCEVSIFNFGNTITETFHKLPLNHYSYNNHILPYVDRHRKCKGMFKDGLITIAALQERVSCKNEDVNDSNGTGTMELLDVFQGMHDHLRRIQGEDVIEPVMSLITGSTHIKFDGKFRIIKKSLKQGDRVRSVYPFNAVGLENPPDRAYLSEMHKVKFPGVMVNIKFPLPSVELEQQPAQQFRNEAEE
ncbi:hypothetical protein ABS849_28905 [Klebsiella pneumoniae]|uniref:hypothetical protein n=1 Tax=Klebsiella pneumoniae complex TaxID=3390273 RepID=UPI0007A622C9|nr:hypothetical protein [Klebsiella variicola]